MKKLNYILASTSIIMMILAITKTPIKMMEIKMYVIFSEMLESMAMMTQLTMKSKIFILMVVVVTTIVCSYSETYMEHYNNKKFFYMLLLFFNSMLVLSSSSSMTNLMIGWEMLGLSSLCLIMFYPSKTSKINSLMTMTFNRMGDIVMIMIFGWILILSYKNFIMGFMSKDLCLMLVICSLTKSAQFPMSAWLPAAMAAPTPISAMVHSSTLVTAGIYIMLKIHEWVLLNGVTELMLLLSILSFFMGGMMSNMEKDYKKMIAFSTMSQISMIMFFSSMSMTECSMVHMYYHALFKTLLFCMAGLLFMKFWGDQSQPKMAVVKKEKWLKMMLVMSVYLMTGILYSTSFYTKDLVLEMMIYSGINFAILMFSIASMMLTMFYSVKLLNPLLKLKKSSLLYNKSKLSLNLMLLSMGSLMAEYLTKTSLFKESFPQLNWFELTVMTMMLMLIPIYKKMKMNNMKILKMNLDIFQMKEMMYSKWMTMMSYTKTMNMSETDLLFLKKKYLMFNFQEKKEELNTMYSLILLIMVMITMTIMHK